MHQPSFPVPHRHKNRAIIVPTVQKSRSTNEQRVFIVTFFLVLRGRAPHKKISVQHYLEVWGAMKEALQSDGTVNLCKGDVSVPLHRYIQLLDHV